MPGTRETLGARQAVLLKERVTDVAHSDARIFRTPMKVSRMGRGGSTPRGVNTSKATASLTLKIPSLIGTSNSPTQNGTQDVASPRRSIIATKARNAKPHDAPINVFLAVHGHSTFIFRKIIGLKTVPKESTNVYARKRMDLTSNYVIGKNPNFVGWGLSPANTADKLKSFISPATIVEGLADG